MRRIFFLSLLTVLSIALWAVEVVGANYLYDLVDEKNKTEEISVVATETNKIKMPTSKIKSYEVVIMAQEEQEPQPVIAETPKKPQLRVNFTNKEIEIFQILVFAEAGGESEEGQVAVAATILNRICSQDFPNTLEGVMNQSGAFSAVKRDGIYMGTKNPIKVTIDMVPEKTKEAVQRALNGENPTEVLLEQVTREKNLDESYSSGGAFYYYNPQLCSQRMLSSRESIQVKVRIGNHIFYKVWDE